MTPMYHWLSRRIEGHVKICVLALMIERIAERTCGSSWHEIRRELDKLQVTKFFDLNHSVYLRNELPSKTANILNKLEIKSPKQLIRVENRAYIS